MNNPSEPRTETFVLGMVVIGTAFGAMLLGLAVGFGIPAVQILHWLQYGVWNSFSTSQGLADLGIKPPPTSWIGTQQVAEKILQLPFAATAGAALFAFGALLLWIFLRLSEKATKTLSN